jgi:hypothetical protein
LQPAVAPTAELRASVRGVVGTALVGARGASARDQDAIDDTAARLCAVCAWRAAECQRHGGGR